MKKVEKIAINIANNKELTKRIEGNKYYSVDQFISDANTYIRATKEGRMMCSIHSVSGSGMSRSLSFHSFEPGKGRGYYRQYWSLFKALGYSEIKGNNAFRINGSGMDMVFHTNYSNMRRFFNLGFIDKATCDKLAQSTPTIL